MAFLLNSCLDCQGIVGSEAEGMCPGQTGTLEYTTEAHHELSAVSEGLKEGAEEIKSEREKEKSLGCSSCKNSSDGVVQNSICSVLLHSQHCHLSKTIRMAEKTFRRDHTGPLSSWQVTNSCPASLELCSVTASVTCSYNLQ